MTSLRTIAALVGLSLLAACSNDMNAPVSQAGLPVPGALAPSSKEDARALQSETPMRNSDNRRMDTRSGLNSDPNNPNGAPGSYSRM